MQDFQYQPYGPSGLLGFLGGACIGETPACHLAHCDRGASTEAKIPRKLNFGRSFPKLRAPSRVVIGIMYGYIRVYRV